MALEHALLAALIHEPMTGYDLARRFDGSVGFFWKATHQQIYRELASLESDGQVTVDTVAQAGRPDKKLYAVTERGRQMLAYWIETPSAPSSYKEDLLVKLFAGPITDVGAVIADLHRHRQAHQERLAQYRHIEATLFRDPGQNRWQYLTLRCGLGQEAAWIAWCDEALAELEHALPAQ